jgi:diaminohydroxyphosphoribosylaminopyrimidine deaminase/5-amino-6-(5-phosphoribosylamino)uracil reductase
VVFDTSLRTPPTARLLEDVADAPVHVLAARPDPSRQVALEARGATVHVLPKAGGHLDLDAAVRHLHALGIRRLLVEGGARIHGALLAAGLADQVHVLVAPRVLGHTAAPPAVLGTGFLDLDRAPRLDALRWRRLGSDFLLQALLTAPDGRHAVSGRSDARS